jgi:hypothetical protein
MPGMPGGLVIGAFTTLNEADRAARALLDAGHDQAAMVALARVGGGRLRLAGGVPVGPVGEPARLLSRAERTGAAALIGGAAAGLAAACVLLLLPLVGVDPQRWLLPALPALPAPAAFAAAVAAAAGLGGIVAAFARPARGLPHDLAFRYALRLDEGDTVLGITAASPAAARSIRETLAINGAILAHVTRGTLEAAGQPAAAVSLAPSRN